MDKRLCSEASTFCVKAMYIIEYRGGSRILLRGDTQVEVTPQCAKHTPRNAKHELSRGVWGHAPPGKFIVLRLNLVTILTEIC